MSYGSPYGSSYGPPDGGRANPYPSTGSVAIATALLALAQSLWYAQTSVQSAKGLINLIDSWSEMRRMGVALGSEITTIMWQMAGVFVLAIAIPVFLVPGGVQLLRHRPIGARLVAAGAACVLLLGGWCMYLFKTTFNGLVGLPDVFGGSLGLGGEGVPRSSGRFVLEIGFALLTLALALAPATKRWCTPGAVAPRRPAAGPAAHYAPVGPSVTPVTPVVTSPYQWPTMAPGAGGVAERFNPPPGWPLAPGWEPAAGWSPDPSWPPAPAGWQFWVPTLHRPGIGPSNLQLGAINTQIRQTLADPRRRKFVVIGLVVAAALILLLMVGDFGKPETVVLSPVDSGYAKSGWSVNTRSGGDSVDCSDGRPSPYDVSQTVRWCGANADGADACWPAADGSHVLCLRDPSTTYLSRIPAKGLSSPREKLQRDPRPFGLKLDNGVTCRARLGGAWSSPTEHPDWVGYFSCDNGEAIWGPASKDGKGDGIDRGMFGWTVQVGEYDGHLKERGVSKVYFVGGA